MIHVPFIIIFFLIGLCYNHSPKVIQNEAADYNSIQHAATCENPSDVTVAEFWNENRVLAVCHIF